MKRILSVIICLAILLTPCAVPARADDGVTAHQGHVTSPVSATGITSGHMDAGVRYASFLPAAEAADALRKAMLSRQNAVTLYVYTDDYWYTTPEESWVSRVLVPMAYSQELAVTPYDGDYLKWSWNNYDWSEFAYAEDGQYRIDLNLEYYTTQAEEWMVEASVEQLCHDLGLYSKTPYEACSTIYDYITRHVSYDYAGLRTIYDGIEGNDNYGIFTAYGAIVNGKAVCQGFATLFYAICREIGLPVRIMTSENHAWNIVQLDGLWYHVDSTWDSSTATHRDWFLKGSRNFGNTAGYFSNNSFSHVPEDEYLTEAFLDAYPISTEDYVPGLQPVTVPESGTPTGTVISGVPTVGQFTDVAASAYYADAVSWALEHEITKGTSETTFSPNDTVTRAQAVTFLWRALGCPDVVAYYSPFSDVSEDSYYFRAVLWAFENGITTGKTNTIFGPDDPVKRGEMITFLWRAQGKPDDLGASFWYASPEFWASKYNLTAGTAEEYRTADPCPRADVVTYMYRAMAVRPSATGSIPADDLPDFSGYFA